MEQPTIDRVVPPWGSWIERVTARPGEVKWPCPLTDCSAVLPSAAYAGEHLVEYHGWSETELAAWWSGNR